MSFSVQNTNIAETINDAIPTIGTISTSITTSNFSSKSFTPTLSFTTTNPTGLTSTLIGYYTVNANLVNFSILASITNPGTGGSGNLNIGNLPYANKANIPMVFPVAVTNVGLNIGPLTGYSWINATLAANSKTLGFLISGDNKTPQSLGYLNLNTNCLFEISGTYGIY